MRQTRNLLYPSGTGGSNPSLSATYKCLLMKTLMASTSNLNNPELSAACSIGAIARRSQRRNECGKCARVPAIVSYATFFGTATMNVFRYSLCNASDFAGAWPYLA